MLSADKKIDALDFRGIRWCHYFCGICTFLAYTIPTFIVMFFGNELIEGIVNNMPDWINTGLGGVAALLPCLGFALLLNYGETTDSVFHFRIYSGSLCWF